MNFSHILYLITVFILLPKIIRQITLKVKLDWNYEKLLKWLDIKEYLNLAFDRVPQSEYSVRTSIVLAILFTYLSLKMGPDSILSGIMYVLSLVMFAYLAHLYSDELFGTFWNSMMTFLSFYLLYTLLSKMIGFVFVDTDWTLIFKNRRLIFFGPYFINPYTGDQIWRFWPPFYIFITLICIGYGSLTEKRQRFLVPYFIFSLACIWFVYYEADYHSVKYNAMISNRGYDPTNSLVLLVGALVIGLFSFLATKKYCLELEEYQINYLQNSLIYVSFIAFIGTLFLLDPPGDGDNDVKPSYWGGFVLNLIFAFGSLVIGFGIGVVLVFGRCSELPVFYVPSIAIIELVRSGPLIAWLFFVQYLVPGLIDPLWDADVASRIILVFSLFFGCYLAEILRGGLQTVPHGQYEAATALGLSSSQIKLQIQLPQAIRTTLPAIVSQMIAMFKDTSLVYFFGITDAFKIAEDIPGGQRDFIGQNEEALVFVGMLFWIVAYYLSQLSKRIEKGLGLDNEGGGEAT